jgi:hypothetical protein
VVPLVGRRVVAKGRHRSHAEKRHRDTACKAACPVMGAGQALRGGRDHTPVAWDLEALQPDRLCGCIDAPPSTSE